MTEQDLGRTFIPTRGLETYVKTARAIGHITERFFGEKPPQEVVAAWKNVTTTMYLVDHVIDNCPNLQQRLTLERHTVDFLEERTPTFPTEDLALKTHLQQLRENLSNLPEDKRQIFLRSLKNIFRVTEKIKTASDPNQLLQLTRLEGQLAGRFFFNIPPRGISKEG